MRKQFLHNYHNSAFAGHRGRSATLKALTFDYYWPGVAKDVRQWCKCCHECQRAKAIRRANVGHHRNLEADDRFSHVSIDLCGHIPFHKGFRYMLVAMCYTLATCCSSRSRIKRRRLWRRVTDAVVCKLGSPSHWLSDRGKEFLNEIMTSLNKLLATRHLKTSGYNPQTNGMNERSHRVLVAQLKIFVGKHQTTWDEWLPAFEFCFNTTKLQESPTLTPYFLVHGRHPRLPQDVLSDKHMFSATTPVPDSEELSTFASDLSKKIKTAGSEMDSIRKLRQFRNTSAWRKADAHGSLFKTGDWVLLYQPALSRQGFSGKMLSQYSGPWRISSQSANTCTIRHHDTDKEMVANARRLVPYTPSNEFLATHASKTDSTSAPPTPSHTVPAVAIADMVGYTMQSDTHVGEVLEVTDDGAIIVHRYSGYNKNIATRVYRPVWLDTKDNKLVYDQTTKISYTPVTDVISGTDLIANPFQLTKSKRLPAHYISALLSQNPATGAKLDLLMLLGGKRVDAPASPAADPPAVAPTASAADPPAVAPAASTDLPEPMAVANTAPINLTEPPVVATTDSGLQETQGA